MAAHEKSPRSLAARGALQKLATGEASNTSILPQIAPSRQGICLDCNGLRSIGHGRGAVCFSPVQGKKIRPDSPACSLWPDGLGVANDA